MKLEDLLQAINSETVMTVDWDDPDYLATLLLKLASYYSSLALPIADAELDKASAEAVHKATVGQRALELIDEGMAVKRAEIQSSVDAQEMLHTFNDKSHTARILFLTRQNLDKTMDAIRSKLSYLKTERESVRNSA